VVVSHVDGAIGAQAGRRGYPSLCVEFPYFLPVLDGTEPAVIAPYVDSAIGAQAGSGLYLGSHGELPE